MAARKSASTSRTSSTVRITREVPAFVELIDRIDILVGGQLSDAEAGQIALTVTHVAWAVSDAGRSS